MTGSQVKYTYSEGLKIPPLENKLKIFGLVIRKSQNFNDAISLPFYLFFLFIYYKVETIVRSPGLTRGTVHLPALRVLPVQVQAVEVVLGDEGQGLAHEGAPLLGGVHQLAVLPTLQNENYLLKGTASWD